MRGASTFSLDNLEPFFRSADTQARAYAPFCRPEYSLVWAQIKGKKGKERKGNAAAMSHGHLRSFPLITLVVSQVNIEGTFGHSFNSMRSLMSLVFPS